MRVPSLLRRHLHRLRMRVGAVLVDAPLDLVPEMPKQALHRPSRAVPERANGVALDLSRDLHEHIDLALVRAAFRSEEHTSELQSHSDLVCRLLLEKKKKKNLPNQTQCNPPLILNRMKKK